MKTEELNKKWKEWFMGIPQNGSDTLNYTYEELESLFNSFFKHLQSKPSQPTGETVYRKMVIKEKGNPKQDGEYITDLGKKAFEVSDGGYWFSLGGTPEWYLVEEISLPQSSNSGEVEQKEIDKKAIECGYWVKENMSKDHVFCIDALELKAYQIDRKSFTTAFPSPPPAQREEGEAVCEHPLHNKDEATSKDYVICKCGRKLFW